MAFNDKLSMNRNHVLPTTSKVETELHVNNGCYQTIDNYTVIFDHVLRIPEAIRDRLNHLRAAHVDILLQRTIINEVPYHQENIVTLENDIHNELKYLERILMTSILDAYLLLSIRECNMKLKVILDRLDVLNRELAAFANRHTSSPFKLSIVSHPIPLVLFKGKVTPESFSVKLISGEISSIQSIGQVKASLVSDNFTYKSHKAPLEHHTVAFDKSRYDAQFKNLSVNISTRMNLISIQFETTITSMNQTHTLVSEVSSPFIVITNESQWCEAAGKVFIREIFHGKDRVSWIFFANNLHLNYLKSTNQLIDMKRPLYKYELDHLHQRLLLQAEFLTELDGYSFWNWFGQCIHNIRFKRHIRKLWLEGYIFGFLPKEEASRVLAQHPMGTFVIRFSDSNPGIFAIAYSEGNGQVTHFLIRGEDIGSNKSLAEFLRSKNQFKFLLKFCLDNLVVRRISKSEALGSFYSKKKNTVPDVHGYVVL